jgi:SNF2 family DNA or RNA helicase
MLEPIKPLQLPPSRPPVAALPIETTELDILRQEIAAIEEEMSFLKESIEEDSEEEQKITREMERIRIETNSILIAMRDAKSRIGDNTKEERDSLRKKTREADLKKKQLLLIEQEERAKLSLQDNIILFDTITAGLPWREQAFNYQLDAARIMATNKRTINADKMGLGKTLEAIMACDMLEAQKILVVAPSDLVRNWEKELKRWSPKRLVVPFYKLIKGVRDIQFTMIGNLDSYVVLVNYEIWRKDDSIIDQLIGLNFDTVILDEAHSIKNVMSDAFQGVRKIIMAENACPFCNNKPVHTEVARHTYHWICPVCGWNSHKNLEYNTQDRRSIKNVFPMTGTPILNRPQELFPLLNVILPEIFLNERWFLDMYCQQDPDTKYWQFAPGALNRLSSSLRGRFISRSAEDVGLELPPQEVRIHEIEFDEEMYPDQARVMAQLKQHAAILLSSGKAITAIATIALITRQRQANVWPGGINVKDDNGNIVLSVGDEVQESMKIDKAIELVKEYTSDGDKKSGDRVVIFSQFKSPLRVIEQRLTDCGISTARFDGDTTESMRNAIKIDVDASRTNPSDSVFQVVLCNYRTGGVGLDFTGIQHTIVLDEAWNPGTNQQAWKRTQRIGQMRETTVDILRLNRTIDTWMAQLLEFKGDVVSGFDTTTRDLPQLLLDALEGDEI